MKKHFNEVTFNAAFEKLRREEPRGNGFVSFGALASLIEGPPKKKQGWTFVGDAKAWNRSVSRHYHA